MKPDFWKGFFLGIMVMLAIAMFVFVVTQMSIKVQLKQADTTNDGYSFSNKHLRYMRTPLSDEPAAACPMMEITPTEAITPGI